MTNFNNCRLPITRMFFLAVLSGCASSAVVPVDVSIHIVRSEANNWGVTYRLSKKTELLRFARNPDNSRVLRWTPKDEAIEIIQIDGSEVVQRKDRRKFDTVEFQLTPTYKHLPKDYAPFSPFSNGGILIHTGRFFACPATCNDKEPIWQFSLVDERSEHIVVNGELLKNRAYWIDSADGTSVYVGNQVQLETSRAWVIIDPAFPPEVVEMLNTNLPRMVDYFSDKFGELPDKPSFFASYDPGHKSGSGSQGGTLPDQIFMHFYGDSLERQLREPDFDLWLSWFFAHEAAHLNLTESNERESWIHEGAADAFSAIILRNWSDRARNYVNGRRENAYQSCLAGLESITLESAAENGQFQLYYDCGLVLHLALDSVVRHMNPHHDGLFALWDAYEREVARGATPDKKTFRRVVENFITADVADWVEQFTTTPMPSFLPLEAGLK